ncbi:hypothetical protein BC628DRAFT_785881 [Trametes gibbosa]|nr:hypothetical protein BC628DRAFT_785881 [Trametes gibbosa]
MSTSTSPTPSASPSSSPPPAPTSSFNSIFQSAGGPPLILVCIAAGLLLGSFIGMFLVKRLRPAVVVQRVNGAALDGDMRLGEKPKLYDVYLGPSAAELGQDSEHPWAHSSPFAAVYLPLSDDKAVAPPAPVPTPTALSRVTVRFHRNVRPGKGHVSAPLMPPLRSVQLAVAVSMPNPTLNTPKTVDITDDDDDCHEDPMPDCCIGTTILPYKLETV